MPSSSRVLVVGTTPDYIDWLRRARADRLLFLTQRAIREGSREPVPEPDEELLLSLDRRGKVARALDAHLDRWGFGLDGIACFDCEWMPLAAFLAERHNLPCYSEQTALLIRDKEATKAVWRDAGVPCPEAEIVRSEDEAIAFFQRNGGSMVLKPTTGSGSELTFWCRTEAEVAERWPAIASGLVERADHPLYRESVRQKRAIVAETYVHGVEYSADFLIQGQTLTLIRVTRKMRNPDGPFGTTLGYLTVADRAEPVPWPRLEATLLSAAAALGIRQGIGMVDFLVQDQAVVLLEMTPRPGGDCLPWLLRHALGLDILCLHIDRVRGAPTAPVGPVRPGPYAGIRLRANRAGRLRRIADEAVRADPRVREVHWVRRPGDAIRLPPEDYESSLLGHLIAGPLDGPDPEAECRALIDRIQVEIAG